MDSDFKTINKANFTGVLNFITQYKQLIFKLTPDEAKPIIDMIDKAMVDNKLSTDNGDKIPYNLSDDEHFYLSVKLDKYDKPNVKRYEKMLKQNLKVFVELNYFNSDEYGAGLTLKLNRLLPIKTLHKTIT